MRLHKNVSACKQHNFLGAQIRIESQLNYVAWQKYLVDYWDQQLCYLIKYSFPLDFNCNNPLKHERNNHSSAKLHLDDIKAYITEEKQFKAIYGPFKECPFDNMHFSPFLTCEKPGAPHRRVIVDLSYPPGCSVNDGVTPDVYLDTPFLLTLPMIDTITQKVKENGKGSLLYKIDLSRAFRHVKIDPKDYNLLGLYSENIYFDSCLPFGFKFGSAIFQKLSDAVRHILSKFGFQVTNYIDDIIGHSVVSKAKESFDTLHKLLKELGFDISYKKMVSPATKVVCLGVEIDTKNFTVSITREKIAEIIELCKIWKGKTQCSKKELQSLLGKLLYITKCVKSSRFFLNRMLDLLRQAGKHDIISITDEFRRDLNWFENFTPKFNGTAFFSHISVNHNIELDACLQGLGARWESSVYAVPLPLGYEKMTIVHLEMLNIMVTIRTWGQFWTGQRICIHCDNQAVVCVLTTGKTKDATLAAIARNILMEIAQFDINLKTVHIRGKSNQIADSLSRWFLDTNCQRTVFQAIKNPIWNHIPLERLLINWQIRLSASATNRLGSALAQSTSTSYDQKFRVFLSFCCFASVSISQISIQVILSFLEFLVHNNISHSSVVNYVSAIKSSFLMLGINLPCLQDHRLKMYNKSLLRCKPLNPHLKTIMDIPMLTKIALHCNYIHMGYVFKSAFLLSFFTFLRISNLVPHTISFYDPLKQLARGDIIFAPPGAHVIIKWSKTLQFADKIKVLKIPSLGSSPLCPVAALKTLLKSSPKGKNLPLFQILCFGNWVPLTDTRLRKQLSKILKFLQLQDKNITFHSFRRSGATCAFNSNIPMQHIQSHGTWTSEAVWAYIIQDHNASDLVATTFQSTLSY